MSGFVWKPSEEYIDNARVTEFQKFVRCESYDELEKKSRQDIGWFWDNVVKFLKLEFFKPYTKVYDDSKGIEWTTWFVGGKVNITYNCLDKHLKIRNTQAALIHEKEDGTVETLTYEQLYIEVSKLTAAMSMAGIKKGDRIGLFMPLCTESIVAFLACCRIGAVLNPIFSGYGSDAVAVRLQDCDTKMVFCCDGFVRRKQVVDQYSAAVEAIKKTPSVKKLVVVRKVGSNLKLDSARDVYYHDFVADMPPTYKCEQTDSEDPFMIIYTSGTTGKPKGSVHVHGGFLAKIAEEVAFQTDLHEGERLCWLTDLGWIMGPWEIVGVLANGGTLVTYEGSIDTPDSNRVFALVEKHKINALGIAPTATRLLKKFGEDFTKKYDLSSLRIFGSTGEVWDPESYMWLFKYVGGGRCPIINLSGGTEVGACFLSPHPVYPLKVCSLGHPCLGMDADVVDDNCKPVRGSVGELVCRKPWPGMTRGLWNAPERFIEAYWSRWKGVWYHGDFASVDSEGYWYLHGRSDDTIKVAGKRVGPAEIESALAKHPAVLESAAVGVPDELKGETVVAFVVLKDASQFSEKLREELKQSVADQLGKPMKPKDVKFVTALPKTRNAKILRRVIRARYLGKPIGDVSNLENPATVDEISKAK